MNIKTIYDFETYRDFLRYKLEVESEKWGAKKRLAEHIGCSATFLSQVLNQQSDFSVEQIFRLSDFYQLSKDDRQFLILIHQKDRSATQEVKAYFLEEMKSVLEKRLNLSKRLDRKSTLNEKDRAIYYSSWLYMAVHFAVGFNGCESRIAIKELFKNIPFEKLEKILNFLISISLIKEEKNKLSTGTEFMWLENNSPWITKHHTSWRIKALEDLDKESPFDVHFSSLCTISKSDVLKIKNIFMDVIKKNSEIIKHSKEERMYVINIDFFDLLK